jgi:hypothetical protein
VGGQTNDGDEPPQARVVSTVGMEWKESAPSDHGAEHNDDYVLTSIDQYENLSFLIAERKHCDPWGLYPVKVKSAAAAGWDDPELDGHSD